MSGQPDPEDLLPISIADIEAAAGVLRGYAHQTPVITSRRTDERTGAQVFFKAENLQRTGSFKFRGAFNALHGLARAGRRRVVAFSSGNHAQAVSLAARLCGMEATIVMPSDAPETKMAATEGYGATIVVYNRFTQDRAELAAELAKRLDAPIIPPFNHVDVMAGQGTAAAELISEVGPLDTLLVCVGGGGLISGCAVAAHALSPGCEVVGVEPEAGNDVQQSLATGSVVTIAVPETIADGAQTTAPGELTWSVIRHRVASVLTASDLELVEAMRWLASTTKMVVEPTGALATAALLGQPNGRFEGRRVGVIISGGNIDLQRYSDLISNSS